MLVKNVQRYCPVKIFAGCIAMKSIENKSKDIKIVKTKKRITFSKIKIRFTLKPRKKDDFFLDML